MKAVVAVVLLASGVSSESQGISSRLAPTISLFVIGRSTLSDFMMPLPAARAGVRFALLKRSSDEFSVNLSAAVQFGTEAIQSDTQGRNWGFGATARIGPSMVTRGGLFMPFFDLYLLATLGIIPRHDENLLFLGRAGVGVTFNAYAFRAETFMLGVIIPAFEVLWEAPNRLEPNRHGVEIRFGLAF